MRLPYEVARDQFWEQIVALRRHMPAGTPSPARAEARSRRAPHREHGPLSWSVEELLLTEGFERSRPSAWAEQYPNLTLEVRIAGYGSVELSFGVEGAAVPSGDEILAWVLNVAADVLDVGPQAIIVEFITATADLMQSAVAENQGENAVAENQEKKSGGAPGKGSGEAISKLVHLFHSVFGFVGIITFGVTAWTFYLLKDQWEEVGKATAAVEKTRTEAVLSHWTKLAEREEALIAKQTEYVGTLHANALARDSLVQAAILGGGCDKCGRPPSPIVAGKAPSCCCQAITDYLHAVASASRTQPHGTRASPRHLQQLRGHPLLRLPR